MLKNQNANRGPNLNWVTIGQNDDDPELPEVFNNENEAIDAIKKSGYGSKMQTN